MDKFREKYIALQKAFWSSNGGAASVLTLYEFKDELEKCGEKDAKAVLVDVYELLGLKKSACELLGKICDPKDRKQLKKLGYLKQYGADGDVGAIKRPKTASKAARQSKKLKALPHFRYHPDPFKTGVFKDDASVVCECCGQATDAYYCGSIYCVADVNYLCPHCIASGAAAAKFDASFSRTQILCRTALRTLRAKRRSFLKGRLGILAGKESVGLFAATITASF